MFQKVLVVEDLDSIGFGIAQMLKHEIAIKEVKQALYCDDAHLKFLRAQKDKSPFDLVITDLSFKSDHRENKITSGDQLVRTLKLKEPNLKTIVYSVEDRSIKVKALFNNHKIDGYVVKGRQGLKYLREAIRVISKNQTYISPNLSGFMNRKEVFEIEDYDITILQQLANGLTQEDISNYLKQNNIKPNGISSIEKRLNRLKLELNAKNVIQLVAISKDLGWI